jgi:hypothetical protein
VTAKVGRRPGHHHDVADPRADLIGAAGAEIRLAGLKRMDAADLDRAEIAIGSTALVPGGRVQAHRFRVTAIENMPA